MYGGRVSRHCSASRPRVSKGNSRRETLPLVQFVGELFLSRFGEGVELGDTAGFSGFGLGFDPALLLEAVEGRGE